MEVNKKELGARIKNLRKSKNLSMEKLAELINASGKSTINSWEKGVTIPQRKFMNGLCVAFDVTEDYLKYGAKEHYLKSLIVSDFNSENSLIKHQVVEYLKTVSDYTGFMNGILIDKETNPFMYGDQTTLDLMAQIAPFMGANDGDQSTPQPDEETRLIMDELARRFDSSFIQKSYEREQQKKQDEVSNAVETIVNDNLDKIVDFIGGIDKISYNDDVSTLNQVASWFQSQADNSKLKFNGVAYGIRNELEDYSGFLGYSSGNSSSVDDEVKTLLKVNPELSLQDAYDSLYKSKLGKIVHDAITKISELQNEYDHKIKDMNN